MNALDCPDGVDQRGRVFRGGDVKLGLVLPPAHNWHIAATGFADEVKAATRAG